MEQAPTPKPGPKLLSIAEVAIQLGVAVGTISELIASGRIPSVKIGRRRLVEYAELDRYVESIR